MTIRNSVFDGDVASGKGATDDGFATGQGLAIWGQDLTVENNEFREFWTALSVGGKDVTVRGNDIHSIRSDGMRVVNVQGVVIEDNHIHDFKGSYASGDHRDMIQFWTTNLKTPNTDIVIRGNRLDIGEGSEAQSIFMRNEAVDSQNGGDAMFYRNVLIEQNVITNAHLHGISVGETHGLTIRDNTIIQSVGDTDFDKGDGVRIPRINVAKDSTGVVITDNISGGIPSAKDGWTVSGNVVVQDHSPGVANHHNEVFVDSSLATGQNPILRPGGLADLAGAGADASAPGRAHDAASFNVHLVDGDAMGRIFDAAQGRSAAELAGTRFEWTFEDGTTVRGPVAMKSFGALGENRVTLTEWRPDGTSSKVALDLMIEPRTILEIGEGGRLETLSGAEREVVDVTRYAEGGGIDLGAKGSTALLGRGDVDRLYKADKFEIAMTLSADADNASSGKIFELQSGFSLSVGSDGALHLWMATKQGSVSLASTEKNLFPRGEPRDVVVSYDGSAGTVGFVVDGETIGSGTFSGTLGTGDYNRSTFFTIGDKWGGKNFDATMSALRIEVTDPEFDPYSNAIKPVVAAKPGGAEPPVITPEPQPEPQPEPDQGGGEAPSSPVDNYTMLSLTPGNELWLMPEPGQGKELEIKHAAAGGGLDLGAKGSHLLLRRSDAERLYQADTFEITMTLEADAEGASGKLLDLQGGFNLQVTSKGALKLSMANGSNWIGLETAETGLFKPGEPRDVVVSYDGEAGTIGIIVDGEELASASFEGGMGTGDYHRMSYFTIGDKWGHKNFDATLSALKIDIDRPVDAAKPEVPASPEPEPIDPVAAHIEKLFENAAFDLDETDPAALKLVGKAELIEGGVRYSTADDRVAIGRLADMEGSTALSASVEVRLAEGGDGGYVLYDHGRFGLAIYDDAIRVVLDKADGPYQHHLIANGLDLDDGKLHRVTVMADAQSDRIQVLLDDEVVMDRTDKDFNVDFDGTPLGLGRRHAVEQQQLRRRDQRCATGQGDVVLRGPAHQRVHRRRPAAGMIEVDVHAFLVLACEIRSIGIV